MGIYAIINEAELRIYIGQTTNHRTRWAHHQNRLRAGQHANARLQEDYDRLGTDGLKFYWLEDIHDPADLITRELAWIGAWGKNEEWTMYNRQYRPTEIRAEGGMCGRPFPGDSTPEITGPLFLNDNDVAGYLAVLDYNVRVAQRERDLTLQGWNEYIDQLIAEREQAARILYAEARILRRKSPSSGVAPADLTAPPQPQEPP